MKILFVILACMTVFASCGDGKKSSSAPAGDKDVVSGDIDSVNDTDTGIVTDTDISPDDKPLPDNDSVVGKEPGSVSVNSGGGLIKSENYRMDISVGKPATGGSMSSDNYKLDLTIK